MKLFLRVFSYISIFLSVVTMMITKDYLDVMPALILGVGVFIYSVTGKSK